MYVKKNFNLFYNLFNKTNRSLRIDKKNFNLFNKTIRSLHI